MPFLIKYPKKIKAGQVNNESVLCAVDLYPSLCAIAGIETEKYYKAVKEAVKKVDDKLLYLGTRLHGTPKYMEGVVRAAGKYCDVISINYYSRWSKFILFVGLYKIAKLS